MVDLIHEPWSAASEPDVTRRTLTATYPLNTIRSPSTTNTFVTPRVEDADVQLVTIDERVNSVWTVPPIAVPAIDLVEIKLHNNPIGRSIDGVLLERVWVVLDESSQELRETGVEIDLAVSPTSQGSVLEIFLNYLLRWQTFLRTKREVRDRTVVP